MHIEGWIFKARIDYETSSVRIAIKDTGGGVREYWFHYQPKLYLYGPSSEVGKIVRGVEEYIIDTYVEYWRMPPWYDKYKPLYVLKLSDIDIYNKLVRLIDENHIENNLSIFNTSPRIPERFLYERGLTASLLTRMEVDGGDIKGSPLEDVDSIDYSDPPYRRMMIRLMDWYGEVYNPWLRRPREIIVEYGGSRHVLRSIDEVIDLINEYDPDIIEYTSRATHRWLSRDRFYREAYASRPRIIIDYSGTVIEPGEYHGLVELSRLARIDVGMASRYTIGQILTTIESYEALDRGMAIPLYRIESGAPRSLRDLALSDRGGIYYIPSPGLYWNVAQCDFTSLYPSIIVKYNISNETVNRDGCRSYYTTPLRFNRICRDIEGLVPSVLRRLIDRRIRLKDLARERGSRILESRQNAIKWILVASFGYLGYHNSRFGKMEAYESVTSYARRILAKTIEMAIEEGYRVIHALVDSILISREDASIDDYIEFCRMVSRRIGIRMELDTYYKWLYLPVNRSRPPIASINRYYGVGYNGEVKIKGIEAVRIDTPGIVSRMQVDAINMLSEADNIDEFRGIMGRVYKLYRDIYLAIINGEIDVRELIITRRVPRRYYEYRGSNMAIRLIKRYKFREGDIVRYIVARGRIAIPVERWSRRHRYDKGYYVERLRRGFETLPCEYIDEDYSGDLSRYIRAQP